MTTATGPATPGHVFVVRGDLNLLAADHVLIPCDSQGYVGWHWEPSLPSGLLPARSARSERLAQMEVRPDGRRAGRLPLAGPGAPQSWFVVTGAGGSRDGEWVADGVSAALELVAQESSARLAGGRPPLVGLPLPGTGAGGLDHRRGEVVTSLLPRLRRDAARLGLDLVLVLADDADWAAVQAQRNADDFAVLGPKLVTQADRLAGEASFGRLALFFGAGASSGASLPSWAALLDALADRAGLDRSELKNRNPMDVAELAFRTLGASEFSDYIVEHFTLSRHGLTHALLANLRVRQAVTTNYDNGYELASGAAGEARSPMVLPRQLAVGDRPWLLKLHGDVADPSSIVLTRSAYSALAVDGVPLMGMVQSLLLTGHLLVVGYSLSDEDVIRLVQQVRAVRARAEMSGQALSPPGTLLALHADEVSRRLWEDDLLQIAVGGPTGADDDHAAAARTLEILLDVLAWKTTIRSEGSERYLLDDRYADAVQPGDRALKATLQSLQAELEKEQHRGRAWDLVAQAMRHLGGSRHL